MDSEILPQVLWAAVAVALAIVIQVAGFSLIARFVRHAEALASSRDGNLAIIGVVTYMLFVLHLTQILAYAVVYYATGAIPAVRTALYFSAATFTTIGGGAVRTAETWQLFAALQGLSGIVLVGASVAFLVAIVHRMHLWTNGAD